LRANHIGRCFARRLAQNGLDASGQG
jgi:hypothetical protein